MNISAKRERPLRKAAAEAALNRRFLKIVRSSIGARWWRSTTTNSGRKITDAARPAYTTAPCEHPSPSFGYTENQACQPDQESARAQIVEGRVLPTPGDLTQDRERPDAAEQPER